MAAISLVLHVNKSIKNFLEHSDVIICLSKDWEKALLSIAPDANIKIIFNAVPLPDGLGCRNNKPQKTINLLFLGLIGDRKGIFDLLDVLKKLDQKNQNFILTIAGNGDIEKLNTIIQKYNLNQKVKYVGWITGNEKEQLFKQTDIFILPSYGEGMPMSILEAMSYGIPVIATDVGGIPEVIIHEKTGILIPPGDKKALKQALQSLIYDSELRHKLGTAAKERIKHFFSITQQSQAIHLIFSTLLKKS